MSYVMSYYAMTQALLGFEMKVAMLHPFKHDKLQLGGFSGR